MNIAIYTPEPTPPPPKEYVLRLSQAELDRLWALSHKHESGNPGPDRFCRSIEYFVSDSVKQSLGVLRDIQRESWRGSRVRVHRVPAPLDNQLVVA